MYSSSSFLFVLFSLSLPSFLHGRWHMYNTSFVPSETCKNKYYKDPNYLKPRLLTKGSADNKWKLWPGLVRQRDVDDGEVLFGFYDAMDIIYNHQHPADCSKAKFLISGGFGAGYGSQVHVEGQGMQAALDSGRVYLRHPGGPANLRHFFGWQTDTELCKQQGTISLDCYYESWSSCTLEDALGKELAGMPNPLSKIDMYRPNEKVDVKTLRYDHGADWAWEQQKNIPEALKELLYCSPMKQEFQFYFFRALYASYMLRPNDAALKALEAVRTLPIGGDEHLNACVAMYVRHGDKHSEMKLVEFPEYVKTMEDMWSKGLIHTLKGPGVSSSPEQEYENKQVNQSSEGGSLKDQGMKGGSETGNDSDPDTGRRRLTTTSSGRATDATSSTSSSSATPSSSTSWDHTNHTQLLNHIRDSHIRDIGRPNHGINHHLLSASTAAHRAAMTTMNRARLRLGDGMNVRGRETTTGTTTTPATTTSSSSAGITAATSRHRRLDSISVDRDGSGSSIRGLYHWFVDLFFTKSKTNDAVVHKDKDIEVDTTSSERNSFLQVLAQEQEIGQDQEQGQKQERVLETGKGLYDVFVGTEDPKVINDMETVNDKIKDVNKENDGGFNKFYYTNLFDRATVTAAKDAPSQKADVWGAYHSNPMQYLSILINLEYSLKCDAWVCTLASNTCRLIDELRATIGGKANYVFADLSKETCKNPPCYDGEDIFWLDWRRRYAFR